MITGALIPRTVTKIEMSCHHRWYLCLIHLIIQTSIHLSCTWFINSSPALHRTLLMVTGALIASIVTKILMVCHHRWYLCLLHLIIQTSIHLSCPWLFNIHPALHRTQLHSFKVIQYLVGLHLIRQIPCHRLPPRMEVAIFMDEWLICLSWHWNNDNRMT